jgi:hypothetical protein
MDLNESFQSYMTQEPEKAGATVQYEDGEGGPPANNISSGNIATYSPIMFRKRYVKRIKEMREVWKDVYARHDHS